MVKKAENTVVRWQAKEYIAQEKNTGWYLGMFLVGAVLVALSVFLHWWTFTALVIISIVALVVYSVRPARMLEYELNDKGLVENGKLYEFGDFKAFGIQRDGKNFSIVLIPRQRFALKVTVCFPEENGEEIVDGFGQKLLMEEIKQDVLDKLVKFLRI